MSKNGLDSRIESLIFSSNPKKIYKRVKEEDILEEDYEDLQSIEDYIKDKQKIKKQN